MHTVPPTVPAEKTRPAAAAYRAHLFSDCDPCAGGHWCSVLDRLDYIAACEANRGK
jgi:hypothetical protein